MWRRRLISARSPQALGRVMRATRSLQDTLILISSPGRPNLFNYATPCPRFGKTNAWRLRRIPPDMFFCAIVAFIIALAFYFVLFKTKLGKAIRATSDNPDLARVTGINTERIILYIWFIGGILAATSGILISMQQAIITPVMGWKILIPLFAAVIVGGIGNPIGALMGGLLIGITGEIATGWINPSYKPAVYFLVLLIVLLLRPNGILGLKGRQF